MAPLLTACSFASEQLAVASGGGGGGRGDDLLRLANACAPKDQAPGQRCVSSRAAEQRATGSESRGRLGKSDAAAAAGQANGTLCGPFGWRRCCRISGGSGVFNEQRQQLHLRPKSLLRSSRCRLH